MSGLPVARPEALPRLKRLYTLGGVATAAYIPFLVLYLSQRDLSPSQIGVTLSASALVSVVLGPLWAHTADVRFGLTRALALTLGTSALLMAAIHPSWPPLVLCAIVVAFTSIFGTNATLEDSLTLSILGPDRASAYGSVRQWASLGWAVAVLGFGAVYQRFGTAWIVPFAVVGILAMLVTVLGFDPSAHTPAEEPHRFTDVLALMRSSRPLMLWLLALTVIAVAVQGAVSFVPLAIADAGGGPWLLALSASVGAMIEIPFFARSESIVGRLGLRTAFVAGVLIQAVVIASWALMSSAGAIALTKVAIGVAFGLYYPANVVITSRLVPSVMRAAGQGLSSMTAALGPVIGAAVGGVVFENIGSSALFVGSAVVAVAGAGVAYAALRGPLFSRPADGVSAADVGSAGAGGDAAAGF